MWFGSGSVIIANTTGFWASVSFEVSSRNRFRRWRIGGKVGVSVRHEAFSRPFFSIVRDGFSCRAACGVVVFSTDSPPFGTRRAANFYL